MLHTPIRPTRFIWWWRHHSFMPFRVNDLPCGITGRLSGAMIDWVISSDYWSQWMSDHTSPAPPYRTKTLAMLDNNQTENSSAAWALFHSLTSRPHPGCNTACPIVPEQCIQFIRNITISCNLFTLIRMVWGWFEGWFKHVHSWVASLLIILLMYE